MLKKMFLFVLLALFLILTVLSACSASPTAAPSSTTAGETTTDPDLSTSKGLAMTLSADGTGELVTDLASVKGRDNFRLEVTVTDGSGATVGKASCSFGRVNLDSVLSQVANVRNGVLFSIDDAVAGRYLYLKKDDRFSETLWIKRRRVCPIGHTLLFVSYPTYAMRGTP